MGSLVDRLSQAGGTSGTPQARTGPSAPAQTKDVTKAQKKFQSTANKAAAGASKSGQGSLMSRLQAAAATTEAPQDSAKGGFHFTLNPLSMVQQVASNVPAVGKALEIADLPRAAVTSAVRETIVDPITGHGGPSAAEWLQGVKDHVGFGDLEEQADTEHNTPLWIKRLIGFAGDVAADPLTYVGAGIATKTAEGGKVLDAALSHGGRAKQAEILATKAAKEGLNLTDAELGSVAKKGLSGLSKDAREAAGIHPTLTIGGVPIPGTETIAGGIRKGAEATKAVVGDSLVGRLGRKVLVPEADAALTELAIKGGKEGGEAAKALSASHLARSAARKFGYEKSTLLTKVLDQAMKTGDHDAIRQALEGGAEMTPEAQLVRSFLDITREDANALGANLANLEDYYPHVVTPEMRDALAERSKLHAAKPGGPVGPELLRKYKAGEEFLGEKLRDGSVDEINAIAQSKLGHAAFDQDMTTALPKYLQAITNAVERSQFGQEAVAHGIGQEIPTAVRTLKGDPADPKLAKSLVARVKGLEKEAKAEGLNADQLAAQAEQAKSVLPEAAPAAPPRPSGPPPELEAKRMQLAQVEAALSQLDTGAKALTPAAQSTMGDLQRRLERLQGLNGDQYAATEIPRVQAQMSALSADPGSYAERAADPRLAKGQEIRQKLQDEIQQMERDHTAVGAFAARADQATTAAAAVDDNFQTLHDQITPTSAAIETLKATRPSQQVEMAARRVDTAKQILDHAAASSDPQVKQVAALEAAALNAEAKAALLHEEAVTVKEWQEFLRKPTSKAFVKEQVSKGFAQIARHVEVPEWIAEARTVDRAFTNSGWRTIMHHFDKVTQLWKGYATLSPGFHVRNAYSGVFMNYVSGFVKLADYAEYNSMWRAAREGTLEGEKLAVWQNIESAVQATGGGFYHSEITTNVSRVGRLNPLSTNNAAMKVSRAGGEAVEDHLRGAMALAAMKRSGADVNGAISLIEKFHFNYADISKFDRAAKRVVPFWMFTSRNLPLQMQMILKHPGAYTKFLAVQRNLQLGLDPESEVVPSYIDEGLGIRTDLPIPGVGQKYLMPDLGFVRVNKDLTDLTDPVRILSNGNPLLKLPAELMAGKKLYNDVPFKDEYQDIPGAMKPLAPVLAALGFTQQGANGQPMATDKTLYALESLLPVAGRGRRLIPDETLYQERWGTSLASFLGLNSATNSPKQQEGELNRRQRELDAFIKTQQQLGKLPKPQGKK